MSKLDRTDRRNRLYNAKILFRKKVLFGMFTINHRHHTIPELYGHGKLRPARLVVDDIAWVGCRIAYAFGNTRRRNGSGNANTDRNLYRIENNTAGWILWPISRPLNQLRLPAVHGVDDTVDKAEPGNHIFCQIPEYVIFRILFQDSA